MEEIGGCGARTDAPIGLQSSREDLIWARTQLARQCSEAGVYAAEQREFAVAIRECEGAIAHYRQCCRYLGIEA